MAYIGVSPQNGVRKKHTYTASGSQTSFTGAGAEGITLSYKDSNFVDVYQNGVKLAEADYTSTSGTTIVLEQAAAANDIVEIIVYDVFSTSDMVSASDGGTFAGNVAMSGTLTLTGNGDFNGDLDVDGTLEADAMTLNGTAITATATLDTGISNNNVPKFTSGVADDDFLRVNGTAIEGRSASEVLSDIGGQASLTFGISNTNIPIFTSGVADDDFLRVNGTSIEGRSASEVLSDIGASAVAGSSSIVTTGALNSGSITSGFGNIDTGSSTITTTGVGTFGSLDISGNIDVDGTTNLDNTDIDGTLNVQGETTLQTHLNLGDSDKIKLGAGPDLEIYHDGSNSYIEEGGTGNLIVAGSTEVKIRNTVGGNNLGVFKSDAVDLYASGTKRFETTSTGVAITGGFTATDGCTITTADNNPQITLVSTDTDASLGPELRLYRNSSSPADSDAIGQIKFNGQNSNGDAAVYAEIDAAMTDVTDGTEDGQLRLLISKDGTLRQALSLNSTTIIVNDAGQDIDFRVEGSGNSNLIRTDAANDRVGIGVNPSHTLDVNGTIRISHNGSDSFATLRGPTSRSLRIDLDANGDSDSLVVRDLRDDSERFFVRADGTVLIGKTSASTATVGAEFRAEGVGIFGRSGDYPLILNRTTDDGGILLFRQGGNNVGSIGNASSSEIFIDSGSNGTGLSFRGNHIRPRDNGSDVDNAVDLGNSSFRFDDIVATNGSIVTSDRNEKQDIEELTDAEKRVAVACKGLMRKYRWKDAVASKGDKARTHFGIIAQDLQDAFTTESLDASKYAMFCSDTWWQKEISVDAVKAVDEVKDEEGNVTTEAVEAKDAYTYMDVKEVATTGYTEKTRLGVRYSELLAFIISAI